MQADVSFLAFFLMWARLMGWQVPALHMRICRWLETCNDRVRVLLVFRGAAKSTIMAVWKAYKLYRNRSNRSLIYSADDKLAGKLTRDTLNVLRRHPLCAGMLRTGRPGALSFWVVGAQDERNPSMEAVGVNSNATGSRADDADFDDIEVPKNIKSVDARKNLRQKIEDCTHILVPGWQKTFVGTPHTHDSIYMEQIDGGAALLKVPLFEHVIRYEQTDTKTRYKGVPVGEDGLYVMAGIGKFSRMMVDGIDYRTDGEDVVFVHPPKVVIDICSACAWPERFTREEIELKRKETNTLNAWDSQYQLEAKPISETRLDPERIVPYNVEPRIVMANRTASMWLGNVRIAGMSMRWDPAGAKLNSDVSAVALTLQDEQGRRYIHKTEGLTGDIAVFADDGKRITSGQVFQICDIVEKYHVPRVTIETNGIGQFAPAVLKAALKQRHLICGVSEEVSVANKNKRILESFEPVLSATMLWAHVDVLEGPLWDQMKDFNPDTPHQADDYIDVSAASITDIPERIKVTVFEDGQEHVRSEWRENSGIHEVEFER